MAPERAPPRCRAPRCRARSARRGRGRGRGAPPRNARFASLLAAARAAARRGALLVVERRSPPERAARAVDRSLLHPARGRRSPSARLLRRRLRAREPRAAAARARLLAERFARARPGAPLSPPEALSLSRRAPAARSRRRRRRRARVLPPLSPPTALSWAARHRGGERLPRRAAGVARHAVARARELAAVVSAACSACARPIVCAVGAARRARARGRSRLASTRSRRNDAGPARATRRRTPPRVDGSLGSRSAAGGRRRGTTARSPRGAPRVDAARSCTAGGARWAGDGVVAQLGGSLARPARSARARSRRGARWRAGAWSAPPAAALSPRSSAGAGVALVGPRPPPRPLRSSRSAARSADAPRTLRGGVAWRTPSATAPRLAARATARSAGLDDAGCRIGREHAGPSARRSCSRAIRHRARSAHARRSRRPCRRHRGAPPVADVRKERAPAARRGAASEQVAHREVSVPLIDLECLPYDSVTRPRARPSASVRRRRESETRPRRRRSALRRQRAFPIGRVLGHPEVVARRDAARRRSGIATLRLSAHACGSPCRARSLSRLASRASRGHLLARRRLASGGVTAAPFTRRARASPLVARRRRSASARAWSRRRTPRILARSGARAEPAGAPAAQRSRGAARLRRARRAAWRARVAAAVARSPHGGTARARSRARRARRARAAGALLGAPKIGASAPSRQRASGVEARGPTSMRRGRKWRGCAQHVRDARPSPAAAAPPWRGARREARARRCSAVRARARRSACKARERHAARPPQRRRAPQLR